MGNVGGGSKLTRMLESGVPGMLGGQTGRMVNSMVNNTVNNRDSFLEGHKSGIFSSNLNDMSSTHVLVSSGFVASSVSPDGSALRGVEGFS